MHIYIFLYEYLGDFTLLQRGTGECLITIATRPNISKEILANNVNFFII